MKDWTYRDALDRRIDDDLDRLHDTIDDALTAGAWLLDELAKPKPGTIARFWCDLKARVRAAR